MPSFLLASRSVKILPIICATDSKGCGRGSDFHVTILKSLIT